MTEHTRKLRCHIDNETNYMFQGIQSSLEEVMEKRSAVLGRDAQYKKTSRISRLPPYLAVQFVRFFWRKDTQKKAKILRRVKYPMKFDAMPLCSDKLRKSLTSESPSRSGALAFCRSLSFFVTCVYILLPFFSPEARHLQVKEQDERLGLKSFVKVRLCAFLLMSLESRRHEWAHFWFSQDEPKPGEGAAMEDDKEEDDNVLPQNISTGNYELIAVITHKGRVADAGHYVGWVRVGNTDDWIKFDDDKVSKVTSDEALALAGGGTVTAAHVAAFDLSNAIALRVGRLTFFSFLQETGTAATFKSTAVLTISPQRANRYAFFCYFSLFQFHFARHDDDCLFFGPERAFACASRKSWMMRRLPRKPRNSAKGAFECCKLVFLEMKLRVHCNANSFLCRRRKDEGHWWCVFPARGSPSCKWQEAACASAARVLWTRVPMNNNNTKIRAPS